MRIIGSESVCFQTQFLYNLFAMRTPQPVYNDLLIRMAGL